MNIRKKNGEEKSAQQIPEGKCLRKKNCADQSTQKLDIYAVFIIP